MDIMTLEERIEKRANARMNRAIDKFKKDIEKGLKELMLDMPFCQVSSVPKPEDRFKWGSKKTFDGTVMAFKLLESSMKSQFIYPPLLLERYVEQERQEILKICDEIGKLSAIYENREDIAAGEENESL